MVELYPQYDEGEVSLALIVNAVNAKIDDAERQATAETDRWVSVGQMDMFNTPEFKIPENFLPQSIAAANRFMTERTRAEQEQLHALHDALKSQEKKAAKVQAWAGAVHQLLLAVESQGMNPEETSIEKAINLAKEVQPRDAVTTQPTAKRTLRAVRSTTGRTDGDRSHHSS